MRKLLELLRTRSETPGAVARIMAGWLHAFLTRPPEDGEEVVAGANLEQLKRMTDLLGKVQTKGLVGSMGGGASPATVGTGPYAPAAPAAPAAPVVVEDMVPASFAEQRLDQMEESLNRLETALTMVVKKMHEMRQSSSPRTQPQTEEQEA